MPAKERLAEPPVLQGFRLDLDAPTGDGAVSIDAPNPLLNPSSNPPPNAPGTESLGSPILKGFKVPEMSDTSRQAASSFAAQPILVASPPRSPSTLAPNPPPNTPEAGSLLSPTLKGFRLAADSQSSRQAATSFAVAPVASPPTNSLRPSPARRLKSPPDELRRRTKVGSTSGVSSTDRKSEQLRDASEGHPSSPDAPTKGVPINSSSHSNGKVTGQSESPVMKGFRLPDSSGRAAAVSFIASPKSGSGKQTSEDPKLEVGLSIVLSATSPVSAESPNSRKSPTIIHRGEGHGGLTWNDVISAASQEEATARVGSGENEEGANREDEGDLKERVEDAESEMDEQGKIGGAPGDNGRGFASWQRMDRGSKNESRDKEEGGSHRAREFEHSTDRAKGSQRVESAKEAENSEDEQVVEDKQTTEVSAANANEGAFDGGRTGQLSRVRTGPLSRAASSGEVQRAKDSQRNILAEHGAMRQKASSRPLPSSPTTQETSRSATRQGPAKPSSPARAKSPQVSDKVSRSDSPPIDPYLLCEPYRLSTFGEPARPSSGGRPLTAERPPSADTVGRFTYSERPVSAERWVAPSEREPRNGEVRKVPQQNRPQSEVSVSSEHSLPSRVGHVSVPQWQPEPPLSPPSSAGSGVTFPTNPNLYPPPFDPQQMQAHYLQQPPGFPLPFPNPALNPYLNPQLTPESSMAASAYLGASPYWQTLSQLPNPLTQSQAFARLPNPLTQSQSSPMQSGFTPFHYPPIPHPYFPYSFPPSFYPIPPVSYPYGGLLPNQLPQASGPMSFPGGPSASLPTPPQQPTFNERQGPPNRGLPLQGTGLQRGAGSSRSELLKARDVAVQRALMRASTKDGSSASVVAPDLRTAKTAPSAQQQVEPGRSNSRQRVLSQSKTSSPQPASDRGSQSHRGASDRALPDSRAVRDSMKVQDSRLEVDAYISEERTELGSSSLHNNKHRPETQQQANGPPSSQSNFASNQPLDPNLPLGPPASYPAQSLPSYDDFLEFLRFRSAYAAHAAPMMQSTAANGALPASMQPPLPDAQNTMLTTAPANMNTMLTSAPAHMNTILTSAPAHMVGGSSPFPESGKVTSAERSVSKQKKVSAACTIQRLWKEHKRRREEKRAKEAPERQTGMLLTWHFRARFLCLRRTVVRLQAMFRGAFARRRFLVVKAAVEVIQRAWKVFRASLSRWQLEKLTELRGFYCHIAGNLEARGLAPSFRRFAVLMERIVAATEGARVRRRLSTRRARTLGTEMKDIRALLQQLEVEKARGRASPDRQLEKVLRIQLRQKHLLLEKAARTPLRYGTNVNTPLPSPSLTPQVSSRSFRDSSGLLTAVRARTGEKEGGVEKRNELQQKVGQQVVGALTSWAAEANRGQSNEQLMNESRRGGLSEVRGSSGDNEPRFKVDNNHGQSQLTGYASAQTASRATAASRAPAEEGRLSFRGASVGFGSTPLVRGNPDPQSATLQGRSLFEASGLLQAVESQFRSRADSFGQFAGPVFRTVDQSLSLSPIDMKSPAVSHRRSVNRDLIQQRHFDSPLQQLASQPSTLSFLNEPRQHRESLHSEGTDFQDGDIDYEDVPYDAQPVPPKARYQTSFTEVSEAEDHSRSEKQQVGSRQTPPGSLRQAAQRVKYDDIPVRSSAAATFRNVPDLSIDVLPSSRDPSENNSPSEKPAKRPFLRARGGRLGTSVSIPEHLKLSIPEPPSGATSELGPSTAPGNFGSSLFSEGRQLQSSRIKREPFGIDAEISVLERDEEGEESEEPLKRAFLQRKSKAMPMQKLDWSKVKPLVEARLDPERYGALQRQASFKREEPPPLPDYRNVKSRLLAYREPNNKYLAQGEEASLNLAEPRSPKSMVKSPRGKATDSLREQGKKRGSAQKDQALSDSDAHVSDGGEAREESGSRQTGPAKRKEAWGSGSEREKERDQQSRYPTTKSGQLTADTAGRARPDKIGRSKRRPSSSAGESGENGGERLSAGGQMVERLYRSVQLERGLDFSSLFPRRAGRGDSVLPRLRSDDGLFQQQADALYKKLTLEQRYEGLRSDSLTFVSANG